MPTSANPTSQADFQQSDAKPALVLVLLAHAAVFGLLHPFMSLGTPAELAQTLAKQSVSAQIVFETAPLSVLLPAPSPAQPIQPTTQTPPLAQPSPVLPAITPTSLAQAPSASPAMAAAPPQPAPSVAAPAAAPLSAPASSSKPTTLIPASRVVSSCALPRYPAASERLREEGVVTLRFLIGENGQVIQGQIDQSSGYKRLDDAALAALSLCKFKPATVDGQPKQDWSALRYRWELKDD